MIDRAPLRIDLETKHYQGAQLVILMGLIATSGFGAGWARANKALVDRARSSTNVFTNPAPDIVVVPGWVEPTLIILAISFFVLVVLEHWTQLRDADVLAELRSRFED